MGVAAYTATLLRTGTPTAFTDEAFTPTGSTTVANEFQITDTTKNIFDRRSVPSFKEGATGSTISSTDVADINYLYGKVSFNSTHATVSASGTYMPTVSVAGAHTWNLTQTADILDDTDLDSTGFRSKVVGLREVSLSVQRWDTVDLDFYDEFIRSTVGYMVVEVAPTSTGPTCRGFYRVSEDSRSGDVGSLEQADTNFVITGTTQGAFAWSDLP
jgi:hypothetical protein